MRCAVLLLLLLLGASGCARRVELLVCPAEVRSAMESTTELGQRRELLFPLDYDVVFVALADGSPTPIELFASQQPPTSPRPRAVTFDQPAHVSDWFIVAMPPEAVGIAIRPGGETQYRVQWFTNEEFEAAADRGVATLKPLEELPLLAGT